MNLSLPQLSNMAIYERIQLTDLMKNSVYVASFVSLTADRAEKIAGKPLPAAER